MNDFSDELSSEDFDAAARQAVRADTLAMHVEAARLKLNRGNPFQELQVELSSANEQPYAAAGYALIYRREGSAPGGRLDLKMNGKVESFYPGARIVGAFDGFSVVRNARSAVKGKALLVVVKRHDAMFLEPDTAPAQRLEPVDLLGDSKKGTFVTVPDETQPSGAAPTGSFDSTGWSRIRVLVQLTSLVSFQCTPWVREPNTGLWFPQPTANVTMLDTGGASGGDAYDRRVFTLELDATGTTFLEFRDVDPAGDPGVIVQGIQ